MGDPLWRFEAEAKVKGSRGEPVFQHLRRRQGTEGVIHFDRSQLCSVELEELLRGCACRIELWLPGWIRPARGSSIETHRGSVSGDRDGRRGSLGYAGQGGSAV